MEPPHFYILCADFLGLTFWSGVCNILYTGKPAYRYYCKELRGILEKKDFTNVTFRVPTQLYNSYKILLLRQQKAGRKTPTADLNYYIRSTVKRDELCELEEEE